MEATKNMRMKVTMSLEVDADFTPEQIAEMRNQIGKSFVLLEKSDQLGPPLILVSIENK